MQACSSISMLIYNMMCNHLLFTIFKCAAMSQNHQESLNSRAAHPSFYQTTQYHNSNKHQSPHSGPFTPKPNPSSEIFKTIKNMVYQLSVQKSGESEKASESILDRQLEQAKMITGLSHELATLKQALSQKQKRLRQKEEQFEKNTKEVQNKHRKQIKKYIDLVGQKQNEIDNLKKSLKSLTSKSLSLTVEIESLSQSKSALQNTVLKSIDSIRSNLKQFSFSLQENELDKVVLDGKYRQLCDKVDQVVRQSHQCEAQKQKIDKRYQKLKQTYEDCRNECIELKFQLQRHKIKIKDFADGAATANKDRKSENRASLERDSGEGLQLFTTTVKQFHEKVKGLWQQGAKIENAYNLSCRIEELRKENENLKLLLQSSEIENDQLKMKVIGPTYQDEILKSRNLPLFSLLCAKKTQIEAMEQKLSQIQKIATEAEDLLRRRFDPAPLTEPHTQSIVNFGEGRKTTAKTHNQQLLQQFETQKQKAVANQRQANQKLREKDRARILQLESENNWLRKQNQRIKNLNQGLEKDKKNYKCLLEEMLGENQPKKKKAGKTKAKPRCHVCFNQFNNASKIIKCQQCSAKTHSQCARNHECKQVSDSESVQN